MKLKMLSTSPSKYTAPASAANKPVALGDSGTRESEIFVDVVEKLSVELAGNVNKELCNQLMTLGKDNQVDRKWVHNPEKLFTWATIYSYRVK